jgi:hypothetical protein
MGILGLGIWAIGLKRIGTPIGLVEYQDLYWVILRLKWTGFGV